MKSSRLIVVVAASMLIGGTASLSQTRGPEYYNPSWSPDGTVIVFESTREGKSAIYTIRLDGSGLKKLTDGSASDGQARWSPDGKQIVFMSNRDGRLQLYLMTADGTEQRRVSTSPANDFNAAIAPDGRRIVFQSSRAAGGQAHDIVAVNLDGTGRTRLTDQRADYMGPRWSPDGRTIAYVKGTGANSTHEIFLMSPDGSNPTRLTNNDVRDYRPNWSPDGRTIYFLSAREGPLNVYSMKADGSGVQKVADGSVVANPGLSPDGKYFAYDKSVQGKAGIYIYEIATGKERLLIGA